MRIAVIGYGGVGKAFVRLVHSKKELLLKEGIHAKICYIIGRNDGIYQPDGFELEDLIAFGEREKDFAKYCASGCKHVDFTQMLENKDVDVVIELTPTNKDTGEPGMTHIARSLESGIHVITANKGPILLAHGKLQKLAVQNRVQLGIGCTTGGALPSVNAGFVDLAGAEIMSIEGVLNGTTNFIINEMETSGVDYKTALANAQQLGIAEADPTLDVEGWDTAGKLLILVNSLMGASKSLRDISVEGITSLTPEQVQSSLAEGKKYKLIGRAVKNEDKLLMTIGLEKVESSDPLYLVNGKNKAVRYTSDTLGDLFIMGGASGVGPAAAAVLRDLININRGYQYCR